MVFHACGRWIGLWRILDAPPELPEDRKWAVVRVGAERVDGGEGGEGGGVEFYEV